MADSHDHQAAETPHREQKPAQGVEMLPGAPELPAPATLAAYSPSLLGTPTLNGRGNAPIRIAMMQRAQQTYGNRALQRFLQRTAAASAVQRQTTAPGGPNNDCLRLLGEILSFLYGGLTHTIGSLVVTGVDLKRGIIERFNDMMDDPADLFTKHRTIDNPDPGGKGSWEGHQQAYEGQQRGLRDRLNQWNTKNCNDPSGGLPQESADAIRTAWEWATRATPQRPRTVPAPPATPSPSRVLQVLLALGLSIALLATVIAAIADPEPATKLGLAGLTVEETEALMGMLGLAAATTR
jgi:hypothetical protein